VLRYRFIAALLGVAWGPADLAIDLNRRLVQAGIRN
jgi:hypothetical protein